MNNRVMAHFAAFGLIFIASGAFAAGLSQKEQLGKIMYQDKDFSYNATQSCQTCHHRTAGFADPTNAKDPYFTVVSTGADGVSLGGRNAPTSSYAGYSPILHWDETRGEWVGGMFWDGRMTGEVLGDPLAEQAQGPPTNPVEMAMPDFNAVVEVVRNSNYTHLFETVFGPDSLVDDPATDDDEVLVYNQIAEAIAAYERSSEIQKFASKYDVGKLTTREAHGKALFLAHCDGCHTMKYTIPTTTDTVDIFTSYSYANIGLPANPIVPLIEPDKGLGYTIVDDSAQLGKFKIPTLRNVAATAPYGHNGYFPTLKSIIEFKNNSTGYPTPDFPETVSAAIGNMGMTDGEINDLVLFLLALTDQ